MSADSGSPPPAAIEAAGKPINQIRRRLSVISDNRLVEGLSSLSTEEKETSIQSDSEDYASWVTSFAGVSKKGYAPYNPRKKNQDILIMEQDDRSRSLLLAVFDGHGEAGDLVAGYFKRELPSRLFAHPEFVTDLHKSLTETLDIIEREIIAGFLCVFSILYRDSACGS